MNKFRAFVWAAVLTVCLSLAISGSVQEPVHIVIAHTNDIHGQLLPRDGVGGLAEITTLVRNMKPDLVLDAGDLFTGTFLSDEFKGQLTIEVMNKIGYTAGTIGNHEFDYGQTVLGMRLRDADFPMLSANLTTPIREIRKYVVVARKGIRFGIIGLTTADVRMTTHPKNLGGVRVQDVVEAIEETLPEVRSRSDFIIVTAHVTDEEERRIARAFPEIKLIVGGHNHSTLGPIWLGQTMVAKTGNIGRNLGRVDLDFSGRMLTHMEGQLIPVQNVAPDAEVQKTIDPYVQKVESKMAEVIGEATTDLISSNNSESSLANLIADAYRETGKTEIALLNIGGIRTRINKGMITWGDVFAVLPFENTLMTLQLTGAQLKKTLSWNLMGISGLRVELDLKKPAGQRLISAVLANGNPIEDDRLYTVTTNDFVVAGGDGFSEIGKGFEIKDTGIFLRDVFVEYIKSHVVLAPALDGRVVVY